MDPGVLYTFSLHIHNITHIILYAQVAYGARTTSVRADGVFTFYRTLPSDVGLNYGRLVLMANHHWYRIAILNSAEEEHYSQVSWFTS